MLVIVALAVLLYRRRCRSGRGVQSRNAQVAQVNAVYEGLEHAAEGVVGAEGSRRYDEDDDLLDLHAADDDEDVAMLQVGDAGALRSESVDSDDDVVN